MTNLLEHSIEIDAGKDFYSKQIDLYIFDVPEYSSLPDGPNPVKFLEAVTFGPHVPGTIKRPSFSISFEAAQNLMDALWNCNIRPSEEPTAGQIQAMNAHLQDMRKLAFAKMEPFTRDGEEWTPTGYPVKSKLSDFADDYAREQVNTRSRIDELVKMVDDMRQAVLYSQRAGDTAEETIVEIITKKIDELRDAILTGDVSGLGKVATGTLGAVEPGAVVNLPADEEFDKSKKYYGPDGSLIRTTP